MIIKAGYLVGTKSMRLHPIKNVQIIHSNEWSRVSINVKNNIISFGNIGQDVDIKLRTNNDYKTVLLVNNKEIFQDPYLFEYEVTIDTENSSLVKLIDDTIYDG
jgi:hypothetical protein